MPLRRVLLHSTDVTNKLADALAALPALEVLALWSSDIKKAVFKRLMKGLAKQDRIKELMIRGCRFLDDKTLGTMSSLGSIRKLEVYGEDIDGSFLTALNGAGMEELKLSGLKVSDAGARWIANIPGLTSLDLRFCGITTGGAEELSGLRRLAVLELEGDRVAPALPAFCAMPNLFRLKLGLGRDDEELLVKVPAPKGLRELEMEGGTFSSRSAEAVAAWPLAELNVCSGAMHGRPVGATIGTAGAKALARCASLEWLDVSAHGIDGEGAAALATLPHLRWLHLAKNPLGLGVAGLSTAPALRVVYLNDCGLPPEAPSALAKIQTLEELNLWNNSIDGTHLAELGKLSRLREVNLVGNPVTGEALVKLRELAPQAKISA